MGLEIQFGVERCGLGMTFSSPTHLKFLPNSFRFIKIPSAAVAAVLDTILQFSCFGNKIVWRNDLAWVEKNIKIPDRKAVVVAKW